MTAHTLLSGLLIHSIVFVDTVNYLLKLIIIIKRKQKQERNSDE